MGPAGYINLSPPAADSLCFTLFPDKKVLVRGTELSWMQREAFMGRP